MSCRTAGLASTARRSAQRVSWSTRTKMPGVLRQTSRLPHPPFSEVGAGWRASWLSGEGNGNEKHNLESPGSRTEVEQKAVNDDVDLWCVCVCVCVCVARVWLRCVYVWREGGLTEGLLQW